MAELKLTFTDSQVTRIKKAIRDKYGEDERTDSQLIKDEITNHLKSIVVAYEKKVEVAKISLAKF